MWDNNPYVVENPANISVEFSGDHIPLSPIPDRPQHIETQESFEETNKNEFVFSSLCVF